MQKRAGLMTWLEPNKPEKTAMCIICRAEFTDEEIKNANACPKCGDKGIPADPREKSTITLTHHEWRILVFWASNWAEHCKKSDSAGHDSPGVTNSILREMRRQQPKLPPLTLHDDIQEAVNALGTNATLVIGDQETEILPEKKH